MLSMWELGKVSPHPQYLEAVISYLGYLPDFDMRRERYGTLTKFYRLKYNLRLEEFLNLTNLEPDTIHDLENKRYTRREKTANSFLKAEILRLGKTLSA